VRPAAFVRPGPRAQQPPGR